MNEEEPFGIHYFPSLTSKYSVTPNHEICNLIIMNLEKGMTLSS